MMFRKLVSNIAFSPALIHEVGFYAHRLRGEEITRRLTLLFIVLTLIMQSLAVFSAPESANASSEQDIIRGGVSSLDDFLQRYDHNEEDVRDIYTAAGVRRSEVQAMSQSTITASDDYYSMSRYGQLADSQKEVSISYARSVGGMGIRYFSPLKESTGSYSHLKGWVGHSQLLGWFAIIQSSGSLVTKGVPLSINPSNVSTPSATSSIEGFNLTSGVSLDQAKPAQSLDKIRYSLKVTNSSSHSITVPLSVRIADLLEYSRLIDAGGGIYDQSDSTLSWQNIQLGAGESQERTFVIQLSAEIAATPTGTSNPTSFDCHLNVTFGNSLQSPIDCPQTKTIEGIFAILPPTDTTSNIMFGGVLLMIVGFFYIRTRQLRKEIRIIRHNFNTGII